MLQCYLLIASFQLSYTFYALKNLNEINKTPVMGWKKHVFAFIPLFHLNSYLIPMLSVMTCEKHFLPSAIQVLIIT